MARDPYAAKALVEELHAVVPDLEVERDGLDGLGVYRTYRLRSATLRGLYDVAAAVGDRRIQAIREISGGTQVTFVADARADDKEPFGVTHATTLLRKVRTRKKKVSD